MNKTEQGTPFSEKNIMINGLYEDTKRKAKKRVRVENAEVAVKDLPLGRTLRLIEFTLFSGE